LVALEQSVFAAQPHSPDGRPGKLVTVLHLLPYFVAVHWAFVEHVVQTSDVLQIGFDVVVHSDVVRHWTHVFVDVLQ
jgi:hypothetical protein